MANDRKRSVTIEVGEATEIKTMYEVALGKFLADAATAGNTDIPKLTKLTSSIAKWGDIVTELEGPAPPPRPRNVAAAASGIVGSPLAQPPNPTEGGDAKNKAANKPPKP